MNVLLVVFDGLEDRGVHKSAAESLIEEAEGLLSELDLDLYATPAAAATAILAKLPLAE